VQILQFAGHTSLPHVINFFVVFLVIVAIGIGSIAVEVLVLVFVLVLWCVEMSQRRTLPSSEALAQRTLSRFRLVVLEGANDRQDTARLCSQCIARQ